MIRAVVFDLDHTLFDRHATLRAIVPALRARFSVPPSFTDKEIGDAWTYADDSYVYDGWQYIFGCLQEKGILPQDAQYADYRTFIYEQFAKTAVRFDDTLPMLETLRDRGYKIALITNGNHALQYKKLELTGMAYIFDEIIVSGDVGVDKPEKEIFLMMCEKLGFAPEETVYVGDNPIADIDGAAGAGMKTVRILSTNRHIFGRRTPDETVETVREIPDAVERIRKKYEEDDRN